MKNFKGKTYFPIILFLLLILFFILWATVNLFTMINDEIKENINSSILIHRAFSEIVISELSSKKVDPAEIIKRMERLLRNTNIVYIQLNYKKNAIKSGNSNILQKAPSMYTKSGHYFKNQHIFVWGPINDPTIDDTHRLVMIFEKINRTGRIKDEGNLLLIIVLLGLCSVTFLILSGTLYIRNRKLMQDFAVLQKRRDQVEEMGLAATGLAHETKNPLGIIRGLAQQIADNLQNPVKAREKAEEIMEEADITTARLGDFMSYAKMRKPNLEQIKAKDHITRIANLMKYDFEEAGITFNVNIDDINISADSEMLNQVLLNILTNSLKSTEKGDKVSLFLKKMDRQYAMIIVNDTGTGIPEDFLPQIFKPYSTRRSGGYGIGMAIVKKIVEESGWTITIKSQVDEGTTIEISNINYTKRGT